MLKYSKCACELTVLRSCSKLIRHSFHRKALVVVLALLKYNRVDCQILNNSLKNNEFIYLLFRKGLALLHRQNNMKKELQQRFREVSMCFGMF